MAQKKITIELTTTEAAHVEEGLKNANALHLASMGRTNPVLERALRKLDKAQALEDSSELTPVDKFDADTDEPVDEK